MRWEFWPPWLAYLPVIPWILYLGIRHRSLTLFTAANPGIPTGGFAGESKAEILRHLACVPEYTVVPASLPAAERVKAAAEFTARAGLAYPLVLKPDAGERGNGVAIARSEADAAAYLSAATRDTIVQRYAGGLEFGVFYYRIPGEPEGRIFSITEKRFPAVRGDGRSTIAELIGRDRRASLLAETYIARLRRGAAEVPARGEEVEIAEIGSHCKGAIFLDAGYLETEELRRSIDGIAKGHPGFYFGRFDVRADSVAEFRAGRVAVLELNGVSAEATHIYDPAVRLREAYRVMFRQWRLAFEIGAKNREAGARPAPLLALARAAAGRG